jgi:hypothetical protein
LDFVTWECINAIRFQDVAFEEFKCIKNPRPGTKIPEFIHHLLRAEFNQNTLYRKHVKLR